MIIVSKWQKVCISEKVRLARFRYRFIHSQFSYVPSDGFVVGSVDGLPRVQDRDEDKSLRESSQGNVEEKVRQKLLSRGDFPRKRRSRLDQSSSFARWHLGREIRRPSWQFQQRNKSDKPTRPSIRAMERCRWLLGVQQSSILLGLISGTFHSGHERDAGPVPERESKIERQSIFPRRKWSRWGNLEVIPEIAW